MAARLGGHLGVDPADDYRVDPMRRPRNQRHLPVSDMTAPLLAA